VGIEIEMTGSGELGPIAPGWNVSEFATPVVIGETAGGTGSVSFNAAAREESLFVVNNNITTTEETLGSIPGVVKSVSQTGLNVAITHDTPLSVFDAVRDIPALGAGGMYTVVDLCSQLSDRDKLLALSEGRFYSMRGHSAGFDELNNLVEPEFREGSFQNYDPTTGTYFPSYFREQYGPLWADTFSIIDGEVWANHVYGDSFSYNVGVLNSRLAFKTKLNGDNVNFAFITLPDTDDDQMGSSVNVNIDASSSIMTLSGKYRDSSSIQSYLQQADLTVLLNTEEEMAVFIEYSRPTLIGSGGFIIYGDHIVDVTICNTSDYSTVINLNQEFTSVPAYYNTPWEITGNVRSIYRNQGLDMAEEWIGEYENPVTYMFTNGIDVNGPVPAQPATNMWEYIQQACSAFDLEVASIDSTLIVRPTGLEELNIDDKTVPTIAPNATLTGRSVEVVFTNAINVVNQELYNARSDNNRIISVNVDEKITTTVTVSGTPTVVFLPTRSSSPVAGVGEYNIIDGKGQPVPEYLFAAAGGRLDIQLDPDVPNAIDITLYAPASNYVPPGGSSTPFGGATPLYPGPYKLAYSSGNDYAALSILGVGVKTTPETLKILTAADPEKTAQDVAKTITNQFIVSKEQAYDRGMWAVTEASGPRVTMSASLPVSTLTSFGYAAGSLIRYRDSIYRIGDATIGNLGMNFNSSRFVRVSDIDALWDGKAVGLFDAMWEGYDSSDFVIAPLRYVGDNESVLMFLDDDVNPYYDFDGDPEISVFPDTDYNPYYEDGGNLEGEDPVYLDTDSNPYDGGEGYGS
jgi:hypothetical protein